MLRPSAVSSASEASCAASASRSRVTRRGRNEVAGLTVAERDRAGLVEQQDIDVAGRLHRAARGREHIALEQPVHAGDADGAEQSADGRWYQANQQRDEGREGEGNVRVQAERLEGHDDEQENHRQCGEQEGERDFVRRLLPGRALDHRNHAINERTARFRSHPNDDPVAQNPRATRDRTTVPAAFAHHRGGFAGDRRLVHRGDAFDHIAICGDEVTGFADNRVAPTEIGGRDAFLASLA
jgi:hypothetical protein